MQRLNPPAGPASARDATQPARAAGRRGGFRRGGRQRPPSAAVPADRAEQDGLAAPPQDPPRVDRLLGAGGQDRCGIEDAVRPERRGGDHAEHVAGEGRACLRLAEPQPGRIRRENEMEASRAGDDLRALELLAERIDHQRRLQFPVLEVAAAGDADGAGGAVGRFRGCAGELPDEAVVFEQERVVPVGKGASAAGLRGVDHLVDAGDRIGAGLFPAVQIGGDGDPGGGVRAEPVPGVGHPVAAVAFQDRSRRRADAVHASSAPRRSTTPW